MKSIKLVIVAIFSLYCSISAFSQADDFKTLAEKGNNCINNSDYSKAIEYFEKAISIGADDVNDLIWTATIAEMCAQQANEPLKALFFLKVIIDLNSQDQEMYDKYFDIAVQLKDDEKQEYVLLKAIENNINNRKYLNRLISFYYRTEEHEKTIQSIDEIFKIAPKTVNNLTIRAISFEKINQPDSAIVVYEEILSLEPENKVALSNLGMIYHNKGNAIYDAARTEYTRIKNPTKEQYAAMTKKFDTASVFYQKSIPLLEKSPPEKRLKDALARSHTRIRNAEISNIFN